MKAVIVKKPGEIEMIETEKPKVGPRDVLIKVKYSGICGTDLAILSGNTSFVRDGLIKYPVRIGHEWSGIVEEIGDEVEGIKPGDRVVSDNGVTCGQCIHCINGDYGLCENVKSVGTVNCWDGSFAEYMLMPCWHVYKLPDRISLEEAVLVEPASIALAGLKQSQLSSDSKLLIIGTGPIGLAAVALAKNMGISNVLLSGRKPYKLDIGKALGADAVVNVTREDLGGFIKKNTDGKGIDVVIETSGNIETINQCLEIMKPKGIITLIGFYETDLNNFNIDKFVLSMFNMKGVAGEFGLIKEVIEIMAKGTLNLKPIITHRVKFDEMITTMENIGEKNDTKIKILVEI